MTSPSGQFVVAIDNGSQSTKVSVIDAEGTVHAHARVPLRGYTSPAAGRWEHPDDDIWESIVEATSLAMSRFNGDVRTIAAVGLCTIRFCRAVLRQNGDLAQPVMSWMDERVARPYVRETPDARWVTTSSGYIAQRLTGEFRDTAGNYQGMWPIDADTWQWSSDDTRIRDVGILRDELFELVMPGERLGSVTAAAAAATGLPAGLPVIATSNDKAVEALGAGLRNDSTALLSLGTYIAAMMPHTENIGSAKGSWQNFAALPHRYLSESDGIRRGMWTVSWFRDVVTQLPGLTTSDTVSAEERMNAEAALVPAGSRGLVTVLDWLATNESPDHRGAILGFDGTQGRPDIHRSILEAIAFTMHTNCARLADTLQREVAELIVTGGGASSDLFMSILASTFGVRVTRPAITDAATMGAAISAAVGVGVHPDWDSAIDAMVGAGETFDPAPLLQDEYRLIEERYHRVVTATRDLFERNDCGKRGVRSP
jgi:xylulokinase